MIRASSYLNNVGAHSSARRGKAPKPGSAAWTNAWENAWEQANPGKTLPSPATGGGGQKGAPQTYSVQAPNTAASVERLPWDVQYEGDVGRITTGRDGTFGLLDEQENRLGLEYGIEFDRTPVDVNGDGKPDYTKATNFRIADNVDVTNPYSRAALLKKSWQQARTGNTNSMAAAGQLYSGAYNRAQRNTDDQYQQGQNGLLTGFGTASGEITGNRFQVWTGAEEALGEAGRTRLETALNAPTPPAPGPSPAPAPPPVPAKQALEQWLGARGATLKDVKWTDRGMFYQRPSDGKWIPVTL